MMWNSVMMEDVKWPYRRPGGEGSYEDEDYVNCVAEVKPGGFAWNYSVADEHLQRLGHLEQRMDYVDWNGRDDAEDLTFATFHSTAGEVAAAAAAAAVEAAVEAAARAEAEQLFRICSQG